MYMYMYVTHECRHTLVMEGEPRQSVDNREMMVVTVCPAVRSGVLPTGAEADTDEEDEELGFKLIKRPINSGMSPFSAMGAGSRPLRMNRSASIMKHLRIGSEMCPSELCSSREREWTQSSRAESLGSIRGTSRVTMFMQDWRVSLWRELA